MPKKEHLELPPELIAAYPEHLRPKRIAINRLAHQSPFPEWPGNIVTPMTLNAEDYATWWEQVSDDGQPEDKQKRHWAFDDWEARYHLVKAWHLEELDLEVLTKDPMKVPDTRLLAWMVTVLQPVIQFSTSIPNSPRPSSDTTKQNEKSETASETKKT